VVQHKEDTRIHLWTAEHFNSLQFLQYF